MEEAKIGMSGKRLIFCLAPKLGLKHDLDAVELILLVNSRYVKSVISMDVLKVALQISGQKCFKNTKNHTYTPKAL